MYGAMKHDLDGLFVAILVADGFEQSEMTVPRRALEEAGASTRLVSIYPDEVMAWDEDEWADYFAVDSTVEEAQPEDFDALLLPGGVLNPDHLRMDNQAVAFVKHFFDANKPVAAICHGLQTMIEANVVRGRTLTSYPSIRTDLLNAGAHWVDQEAVVDRNLISSRSPKDLRVFCPRMIEVFRDVSRARKAA